MTLFRNTSRRVFLRDLGRGAVALAIVGVGAACSDADDDDAGGGGEAGAAIPTPCQVSPSCSPPVITEGTSTPDATAAATAAPSATESAAGGGPGVAAVEWRRVSLGFVSAYVLVRGGEAAIVDTGSGGSAGAIEEALGLAGVGWGGVGHVIATHAHGDHVGSLGAVLAAAPDAAVYAGAGDIPSIASPRPLLAVGDGDRVFELEIIATPGHTPGHVSVLDPVGGLLVAGDALIGQGGAVVGPNPQFSSNHDLAIASVGKLASLQFETVVFGHGDPVEGGASARVAALAATL